MELIIALHWRHNDHDGVSNHQPHGCLLSRLFRRRSKKTSKLRVTGLCVGNSPGPVNSPHKGPVTRKMFPFDDVIMGFALRKSLKILICSNRDRWCSLASLMPLWWMDRAGVSIVGHLSRYWLNLKMSDVFAEYTQISLWHLAISWINIDLSYVRICAIQARSISQERPIS